MTRSKERKNNSPLQQSGFWNCTQPSFVHRASKRGKKKHTRKLHGAKDELREESKSDHVDPRVIRDAISSDSRLLLGCSETHCRLPSFQQYLRKGTSLSISIWDDWDAPFVPLPLPFSDKKSLAHLPRRVTTRGSLLRCICSTEHLGMPDQVFNLFSSSFVFHLALP